MDGLSEASIRRMWEKLASTTPLRTTDDRPLVVLSPGAPNSDGGPDYADALIRLDGRLYRGDVEVHLHERDWKVHRHNTDVHYNRVILHVVGIRDDPKHAARTRGKRIIPTVIMHPEEKHPPGSPCTPPGAPAVHPCAPGNFSGTRESMRQALMRLGWERLERRVVSLDARLNELLREVHWCIHEDQRHYGTVATARPTAGDLWTTTELGADDAWSQLLYEGIVEGMGYAKNKKPFRELAQYLPLRLLRRYITDGGATLMALLFGVAGLLPSSRGIKDRECRKYLLRLRKQWNSIRKELRRPVLHEADWLFFRLRPVNFPTARLAVLGHILPRMLQKSGAGQILNCFRMPGLTTLKRRERLRQFFAFAPDPFWSMHLHFRGRTPGPSIALGTQRIDAIIFSTIVPAVLLYARVFDDRSMHRHARTLARALPAPPHNIVTRTVERDVFRGELKIDSALLHHGAIELHRRYCEAERCVQCPLGPPSGGPNPQF